MLKEIHIRWQLIKAVECKRKKLEEKSQLLVIRYFGQIQKYTHLCTAKYKAA